MIIHYLRSVMLPLAEIDNALPKLGNIYELGSGWGSIATFLAEKSEARCVVGIDLDAQKIEYAKFSTVLTNVQFIHGDVLKYSYKKPMGFVMSDFLHHIPYLKQEILLKKIIKNSSRKTILLIKEIDANDGWRKWLSRFWDLLLYPHDSIYYRSKSQWRQKLENLGYNVSVMRAAVYFPGSTILFICQKKS